MAVLAPQTTVDAFFPSIDVAIGDFNGDGIQDLAVNERQWPTSIFLSSWGGEMAVLRPPFNFETGEAGALPFDVSVGDFNGDGTQDLAVTNSSS